MQTFEPKTEIPPNFLTHELTHRYSGNGLYFLHDIGNGWIKCGVFSKARDKIAEAFTLRRELVEKFEITTKDGDVKDFPIHPAAIAQIKEARTGLESGKLTVRNCWMVPA